MTPLRLPLAGRWDVGATLAEGPTWSRRRQALLWVDVLRPSVNWLDPATGRVASTPLPDKVGSATEVHDGSVIAATAAGFWRSRGRPPVAPPMAGIIFNDGKCDARGRFWVGTRAADGGNGGGALWRIDASGAVRVDASFDVPNGLGWSPDGRTFYLIDTIPRLVWAYDVDPVRGALSNKRVLRAFDRDEIAKPDGLTVAADGSLWIAMWDGAGIRVLNPDGRDRAWLPAPCARPTSCAFGGRDGTLLLVTTARHGLGPTDPTDASGSILAFEATGVASGGPAVPFRG